MKKIKNNYKRPNFDGINKALDIVTVGAIFIMFVVIGVLIITLIV